MLTSDVLRASGQLHHRSGCQGEDFVQFVGHEGSTMLACRGCKRAVPASMLLEQADKEESGSGARYRLSCVRCDADIPVSRPTARLPLCARCARQPRRRRGEGD